MVLVSKPTPWVIYDLSSTARHDCGVGKPLKSLEINTLSRPFPPLERCRRLCARSGEEVVAVGHDGEERHAQSRDSGERAHGGRGELL